MILVINTADGQKIFIGLINPQAHNNPLIAQKNFFAQYRQAEKLLPEVIKLLQANKITPQQLTGITVVVGPGPFSALRIGVVTAKTLAWALNIPLAGIKLNEFKDINSLIAVSLKKIKTAKRGETVLPFYGQSPNITKKKKVLF